jgi:hypothetical protein
MISLTKALTPIGVDSHSARNLFTAQSLEHNFGHLRPCHQREDLSDYRGARRCTRFHHDHFDESFNSVWADSHSACDLFTGQSLKQELHSLALSFCELKVPG